MRQVFSSLRLENVEGVATVLEEAGIEVRITGGRSYKSGWSGRRTYNDSERVAPPAVWVVKSEDQPRARQLLRDAGLLESTQLPSDSYLGPSLHQRVDDAPPTRQRRALRAKIWLLAGIAVIVLLVFKAMQQSAAPPSAPEPAAPAPVTNAEPATAPPPIAIQPVAPPTERHTVETPPALAAMLLAAELRARRPSEACVGIDGTALAAAERSVLDAAMPLHDPEACSGQGDIPLAVDVRGYTTDGSGRGTIEVAITTRDDDGATTTEVRELTVAREGTQWRVLDSTTPN